MAKTAVHFGAGNIGRGFVACFLHNSGYDVIFADVQDALIDKINAQSSYKVIEVGTEGTSENTITNYKAINSKTHEADLIKAISTADIVTCSVGPNILKFIAPVIAKGIDQRSADLAPLHVIACENAIGATDTLASFIKDPKNTSPERLEDHDTRARYANSAIDRIVPAQDPNAGLDVTLEKFFEWVVDKTPFEDVGIPDIVGVNWVDNLAPFIERKLFTVNTGHATAAYHGYNRKKRTVYDALQDKNILAEVRGALNETKTLIVSKHGIDEEAQAAYVEKIIKHDDNEILNLPLPTRDTQIMLSDAQTDNMILTCRFQQVQRQAQALAQDPPRPLDALPLPSSFDPNDQTSTLPTVTAATSHLPRQHLVSQSTAMVFFLSPARLQNESPFRGIEMGLSPASRGDDGRRVNLGWGMKGCRRWRLGSWFCE
jgi:mannitol-1-phosphate 5-dehydrogenase